MDGCDRATLRDEQLHNHDVGQIQQEVETVQRSEWKDTADYSHFYKSCWAQWNSLAVRDGVLEHNWELTDRRTKTAQIVLPSRKVKEVLQFSLEDLGRTP